MIKIKFEENKSVACDDDKKIGECDFIEENDTWNIIHTEVDNTYQGQGIAKKLVECVIENAKKQNKNIINYLMKLEIIIILKIGFYIF